MDRQALVAMITEAVLQRLSANAGEGVAPSPDLSLEGPPRPPSSQEPGPPRRGVIALDRLRGADALWQALRSAPPGASWTVALPPGSDGAAVAAAAPPGTGVMDATAAGKALEEADVLVVPFLPLHTLAKIVTLMGDDAVSTLTLAALAAGIPIVAATDDVQQITRLSSRLPAAYQQILEGHLRTLENLGVRLTTLASAGEDALTVLAGQSLPGGVALMGLGAGRGSGASGLAASNGRRHAAVAEEGGTRLQPSASAAGAGKRRRQVVTSEDVVAAHQAGHTQVQYPRDAIVTGLAEEEAAALGITIRLG